VPVTTSAQRRDSAEAAPPTGKPGGDSAEAAPPTGKPGRIASLDWVRGWFLCGSVATASVLAPRPAQLVHAEWTGVRLEDLVFPLFVTLSGAGLAFAYRNAVGWRATLRRSAVLLFCGLVYNAVAGQTWELSSLRLTGTLQLYAVLVLVIGVLHLVARGPRAWVVVTALVALAQGAFLSFWQGTCPGDALTPACNPSAVIDRALLGPAHMYAGGALGHDPEGLMGILGACVTASAGAAAGHLALSARGGRRGPSYLLGWAVALMLTAVLAVQLLPAMKRLWTTPFALGAGALGIALLALGMAVLDLPAGPRWTAVRSRLAWPQIALGRNSLLVYFGSHLLMDVLLTHGGDPSWAHALAGSVAVAGRPRVGLVVLMVLGWAVVAAVLHRRRIYLRP
jgi:heparan-alpha-glucosaminide N-acetyltransferase